MFYYFVDGIKLIMIKYASYNLKVEVTIYCVCIKCNVPANLLTMADWYFVGVCQHDDGYQASIVCSDGVCGGGESRYCGHE